MKKLLLISIIMIVMSIFCDVAFIYSRVMLFKYLYWGLLVLGGFGIMCYNIRTVRCKLKGIRHKTGDGSLS